MGVHAGDFAICSVASRQKCGKQHSIYSEPEQRDVVPPCGRHPSEGVTVNARACSLSTMLRDGLASLPGAASISLHAQEAWALFLIMATSDEAVISLSESLGLALAIRHEEGRWWRVAVGERDQGALRCEICGPRHRGQPPDLRAEHAEPPDLRAGRAERMQTAPVTLTAEQVLEAARARGVPVFDSATGERPILLASLGLDLGSDDIRAALLELHQGGELRLVSIIDPLRVRADLDARGLRFELVADSAVHEEGTIFHAVVLA